MRMRKDQEQKGSERLRAVTNGSQNLTQIVSLSFLAFKLTFSAARNFCQIFWGLGDLHLF